MNIWSELILIRTALMWACYRGHTEIVKLLLQQKGIDINPMDFSPFSLMFDA